MKTHNTYTVFDKYNMITSGSLQDIVLEIKKRLGKVENNPFLIFSDLTGKTIDFNFQGTQKDILKRLEVFVSPTSASHISSGPGRPRLGVVSREVSLLPKHWEWLALQPGGASGTLRRLVENEIKKDTGTMSLKQLQERCYQAMSILAGDLENYESALRALYKKEETTFLSQIKSWPKDIKKYVMELANPIFHSYNK